MRRAALAVSLLATGIEAIKLHSLTQAEAFSAAQVEAQN